jgi:hypothetical protein
VSYRAEEEAKAEPEPDPTATWVSSGVRGKSTVNLGSNVVGIRPGGGKGSDEGGGDARERGRTPIVSSCSSSRCEGAVGGGVNRATVDLVCPS